MQYYSQYGHRDFVLCLGYRASTIKEFFFNWRQQRGHMPWQPKLAAMAPVEAAE